MKDSKTSMIRKILVPLDFSPTALNALSYAQAMARLTGAEITLLHVVENMYATTDPFFAAVPRDSNYEFDISNMSKVSLEKAAEKISDNSVSRIKTVSVTGRTHKEIVNAAKKLNVDMVIMGTHGVSGFREFVVGSNTYRVASDSEIPVLSVQKKGRTFVFKNMLVPFTDQPHSREKVMYAIKLAGIYGASLNVLGINDQETKAHGRKISLEANQIKSIAEDHGIKCKFSVVSAPNNANTILKHAKKVKADLIISTGDLARQSIGEFISGSLSQQIVNHSPLPVLSVHSKYNPKALELWHGI